MHYRKLGRTELRVSEIGYGTNMLGRRELTESEHIAMVHRAMELGINCVDTADVYQEGQERGHAGESAEGTPRPDDSGHQGRQCYSQRGTGYFSRAY